MQLDVCDFCKYKPPTARTEAQLSVVEIRRDPTWIVANEQSLRQFWTDVMHYRAEHADWSSDEHRARHLATPTAAAVIDLSAECGVNDTPPPPDSRPRRRQSLPAPRDAPKRRRL